MECAIFIPVRLSSTRLPSKALLKINNKPCIQYLIERIKKVEGLDGIILCTTKNSVDDEIVNLAKQMKIDVFRGSEQDILERFNGAAKEFDVKYILNVDGDDILCEPEFIRKTAYELKQNQLDFISWKNMPLGTTPIGIKTSALMTVCNQKNNHDTETGWGKFFTETGMFNVKFLTSEDPELKDEDLRLTLDYPEDFKLFEQLLINLEKPFDLKKIIKFLNSRKDIKNLNKDVREMYWKNFEKKSTKIKMKSQ